MLRQRIITALVMAVVLVGTVLYGDTHWVSVLFALVLLAATRELLALTVNAALAPALVGGAAFALLFWWSSALIAPQLIYLQSLAGVVLWLLIALGFKFYRHSGNWPMPARVLALGLGLGLLWICVHCLVFLHREYGGLMLLYLFTLVWIADIGAYFSGRAFGRHKLAPAISPGKTWEGVLGGVFANLVWISLIYMLKDDWGMSPFAFLLIGIATVSVSIVGDLFESVIKREAGAKDSGKLLPGHGGVLDRIDSVIAASPVFIAGLLTVTAT